MTSKTKSPNFTELEKEILIELVEKRKHILENKQNDGKSVSKKNDEWSALCSEFNSRHGVFHRTANQLKSLWKNLKARAKSNVAKERKEKKKTGGGTPSLCVDKITNVIHEMLPQQINSLANPFDDDADFHGDQACHNQESSGDELTGVSDSIISTSANNTQTSDPTQSTSSESTSLIVTPSTSGSTSTEKISCKKRKAAPGSNRQDQVKSRLLEMSEEEHKKKMRILQLKEDVLLLKKQKLECELKQLISSSPDQHVNDANSNSCTWRPF